MTLTLGHFRVERATGQPYLPRPKLTPDLYVDPEVSRSSQLESNDWSCTRVDGLSDRQASHPRATHWTLNKM